MDRFTHTHTHDVWDVLDCLGVSVVWRVRLKNSAMRRGMNLKNSAYVGTWPLDLCRWTPNWGGCEGNVGMDHQLTYSSPSSRMVNAGFCLFFALFWNSPVHRRPAGDRLRLPPATPDRTTSSGTFGVHVSLSGESPKLV